MGRRGAFSFVGPVALWASLLVATIFHSEGTYGFKPFLNLEALLLVGCGTIFCLNVAYPLGDVLRAVVRTARGLPAGDEDEARRWGDILRHGADSAMGMGGAATLLGMILMLTSIDDISAVPRRMALSLTAIFYGLMLSEAFFVPLARRVRSPDLTLKLPSPGGGKRRLLVGLGSVGSAVLSFFVILYSLSSALASDIRAYNKSREVPRETNGRIYLRLPLIALDCDHRRVELVRDVETDRWLRWVKPEDFAYAARLRAYQNGDELVLQTSPTEGYPCVVRGQAARPKRPARASLSGARH